MTSNPDPLSKEIILAIHSIAIEKFGGSDGLRDEGLLESALSQPFQTFEGKELYPTITQKAARYAFGIASNHPFIDGNKRTATATLGLFLRRNGYHFAPPHAKLLSMMLGVANGNITFEELAEWIDGIIHAE